MDILRKRNIPSVLFYENIVLFKSHLTHKIRAFIDKNKCAIIKRKYSCCFYGNDCLKDTYVK